MFKPLIIIANLHFITCNYLEAAANYQKPRLERNNIVNKGVWVRNKDRDKLFEKTSLGNVIFRPSSLDADRLVQSSFDAFANDVVEESPFVSAYVERGRRSTDQMRKRHSRKSIKNKKFRYSTVTATDIKFSSLKPTSAPNDYHYDVGISLNNSKKETNERKIAEDNTNINNKNTEVKSTKIDDVKENITDATYTVNAAVETKATQKVHAEVDAAPKRSRKHNYGIDDEEPLEFVEDFNRTDGDSKTNRGIIHKSDKMWHQNAPIPDTHVYEVVPKDKINKAVSERGLIKVISMLTKTFKRIMKQHNEVKRIYGKLNEMNEDFTKQVTDMNIKFQDFDSKYSDMIQFNDKLKALEDKLVEEEERLKIKHNEMDNNISEFESQQKKFLAQQKQFYAIQKVMLAQNEKIHLKQSMIAKTQSEISHRQNNFARILKKTKQLITDKKVNLTKDGMETITSDTKIAQTTNSALNVETVKFNLFAIPIKNKLSNQDDLIIKEKDKKPIDDLVYKYYFNNTFIDNLMKNKVLNHYAVNTNSIEIARNTKNKRNELETTLLLPIKPQDAKSRVRRWINNFYNKKNMTPKRAVDKEKPDMASKKNDPFTIMAKSFCNEIGQNTDTQALNWCVEKALRRLRFMENKLFPQSVTVMKELKAQTQVTEHTTEIPKSTLLPFVPTTMWLATSLPLGPVSTPLYAVTNPAIFFPDNDELESNLKQYDLTPDTEGNVYYDSSLHLSDFEKSVHFSNSQENPIAVDLQSKRRAYVKRLNEDILSRIRKV